MSLRVLWLLTLASAFGCDLAERSDFLVGRLCDPRRAESCDLGQACLPHALQENRFDEFRCRDRVSFEPIGGREAPLAYCQPELGYLCPGDLVCNADRIRSDAGRRALVCKLPDDVFGPPLGGPPDGGA